MGNSNFLFAKFARPSTSLADNQSPILHAVELLIVQPKQTGCLVAEDLRHLQRPLHLFVVGFAIPSPVLFPRQVQLGAAADFEVGSGIYCAGAFDCSKSQSLMEGIA